MNCNYEGVEIPESLIKLLVGYKKQNDTLINIINKSKSENLILLDEVKKLKFKNFKIK